MKDPNSIAVTDSRSISDPKRKAVFEVIERTLDGMPLREAVKASGLTPQLFNYRLQNDREAAVAYSRAVEIKADMLADEVVHIADSDTDPAKVRNQITARQWLAGKLYSKRYGDRIDLNVTQTIDVSATLAEARARLLPVRDLSNVIDVQSVATQGVGEDGASDNESLALPKNPQPDIFS